MRMFRLPRYLHHLETAQTFPLIVLPMIADVTFRYAEFSIWISEGA